MMCSKGVPAFRAMLVGVGAFLAAPAFGAGAAQPGMTYESLKDLPDFGGGWVPVSGLFTSSATAPTGGPVRPVRPNATPLPRELKPEVAARAEEEQKKLLAGEALERVYCEPQSFSGVLPMNAGGSLEVLFTPGRVTLATESGLVRRLYIRDTPPVGALEESRGGMSLAHWEGATLVVQTTGLSRSARLLTRVAIGARAQVVERISLKDANTLEIESTLTAPDILTGPLKTVNRYQRARDRLFTEFNVCVQGDRAFDAASKVERFDATPPPDLPPPPTG